MGLLSFAFTGAGFILIGAHEALNASLSCSIPSSPHDSLHPPTPSSKQQPQAPKNPSLPSLFLISISIFSFFFVLNSLVSLVDASNSRDGVGVALQLQVLPIALIFLLYSLLGLLANSSNTCFSLLPSSLLGLIGVFAFVEEFSLFCLQRKDPSGIENRYYDFLLIPIAVCAFSTIFEMKWPKWRAPKLGRGVGLILQGTWFVQLGLSVFSSWMAQGCYLHRVSRGNYTVMCKGDPEYHRARAIATLQFNCHLAFMVMVIAGLYSITSSRNNGGGPVDSTSTRYRPLGAELQSFENSKQLTLVSEDDADEVVNENIVESRVNVYDSHD